MEWLSPITGLIAAGIAVPTLVILYFLKLKRRDETVSSTLLWKRAVQDLQVNAPFQRLRRNILLWLQLAALAAALVALARPVLSLQGGPPMRQVILIDQSASMAATDVAPSRLTEAKEQAKRLVESLRGDRSWFLGARADEAMVIAFGSRAKVLCNYTADKVQLAAAIDSIQPTDGDTQLAEAVTVARAYASSAGPEDKGRSAESPARLDLFSDGRIADIEQITAGAGEVKFHAIGTGGANVGITAMQARRSFETPEKLTVFVDLGNYGPEAVTGDVELSIDGNVRAVQSVTVAPREPEQRGEPGRPGHTAQSFVLTHPGGGILQVRLLRPDALAADNAAWAIVQPPRPIQVALVTEDNPALVTALKSCTLARLETMKPAEFERRIGPDGAADIPYDLVVLDRWSPAGGGAKARLPRANYLVFGAPPAASGARAVGEIQNQWVVDWRARHPVLNFVNMENLFASKALKLDLPREATVLAEFENTPALVEIRRQGGMFLLVSFDSLQSNWPFDAGFVMFCYNVVGYVGSESAEGDSGPLKVGQPITFQGPQDAKVATVTPPVGGAVRLPSASSGVFRYPATARAGVYRLAVEGGPEKAFAVNLLDARESDIGPARELVFSGQVVKAEEAKPGAANQEVWPWLVLLALAVVCLEWFVYHAKVRL